ncbi:MAG TPA: thioredoxin domain-containing protein, partial [Thermoplasmata archaeon]
MAKDGAAPAPETGEGRRLANARSAYLRGAAEQPIEWYPWGPEPFEVAKRRNVPILLDIGAVWCHWCHVMDEGTYSDREVARILRQNFVAVKVDRDENPEVDRRYQRQVSALTGQGGWPLTAFLTPAGEVFLGGTYFPPEDALGRPGFRRVLKEVARIWREEPEKALGNVRVVDEAAHRHEHAGTRATPRPIASFLASVHDQVHQSYDAVNGGFGFAPKFPHPTAVSFLLFESFARADAVSAARARESLLRMADGGMYDQLGGGFHRYSVDESWHIPHFEKMGADNAALLQAYVEGARRFGDARLVETVQGILAWTSSVLSDPQGGFGASQDADNAPGDDGNYFTWSRPELKAVLAADELKLASRFFGVGSDGRMPHDPERNVLYRLLPLPEAAAGLPMAPAEAEPALARAIAKLRAARGLRSAPYVDRALYADLNGSFIRAFASAGQFLGDAETVQRARAAADRFLSHAYSADRGVAHLLGPDGPSGFGHLEDQAQFSLGLLELAGVTAEPKYVEAADTLLNLIEREYTGPEGLLRDLAPRIYDGPTVGSLASPAYPLEDNPHLAANAAVALAYVRRAALGEDESWREKGRSLLAHVVPRVEGAGLFASGTALAAGLLETAAARVVIEGTGPASEALRRSAERSWHPNLSVFAGHPPPPFSLPAELRATA